MIPIERYLLNPFENISISPAELEAYITFHLTRLSPAKTEE